MGKPRKRSSFKKHQKFRVKAAKVDSRERPAAPGAEELAWLKTLHHEWLLPGSSHSVHMRMDDEQAKMVMTLQLEPPWKPERAYANPPWQVEEA